MPKNKNGRALGTSLGKTLAKGREATSLTCINSVYQGKCCSYLLHYVYIHLPAGEESRRVATLEEFSPENLVEIKHLHMILIGHTGVGKTSVVKHLKGEKIDPDENSTEIIEPQLLVCMPK